MHLMQWPTCRKYPDFNRQAASRWHLCNSASDEERREETRETTGVDMGVWEAVREKRAKLAINVSTSRFSLSQPASVYGRLAAGWRCS